MTSALPLLLLAPWSWACAGPSAQPAPAVVDYSSPAEPPAAVPYADRVAHLAGTRAVLAERWTLASSAEERSQVLSLARSAVLDALTQELIPAWYGTPWDFYGTTETPGQGTIACGYFVTTVLRDAGFQVDRVWLAQQASERILRNLVPEPHIARYRLRTSQEVATATAERGDGLYMVGLDNHVGLLHVQGGEVHFCHSSFVEPVAVLCEPAATALAFESRYRVVGRLLGDGMMTRWLEGTRFPRL